MTATAFPDTAAWRLAVARAIAWGLWLGAWLVLGALGRQASPLWAGGVWPMAACLLAVGAGMAGLAHQRLSATPLGAVHLRWALPGLGLWVGAALAWWSQGGGQPALALAAIGWGLMLVAASQAVRLLRQGQRHTPAPVLPAVAGAAGAWLMGGDGLALIGSSDTLLRPAFGLALAACGLALLVPGTGPLRPCRAGLFDCAWPVPAASAWREPTQWPLVAARLSMLPMMAALPLMGEWCAAEFRWPPGMDAALHLGAMLLPAVALRWRCPAWLLRHPEVPVLALQGAGVVMLAWQPGLASMAVAALAQSAAWSLAWALPLYAPTPHKPSAHSGTLGLRRTAATAAALLALGTWLAAWGPWAWMGLQAALALLAVTGTAIATASRLGRWTQTPETTR